MTCYVVSYVDLHIIVEQCSIVKFISGSPTPLQT